MAPLGEQYHAYCSCSQVVDRGIQMPSWPDGKSVAVAFIVPWELWPDDVGTKHSNQRESQRPIPDGAYYARNMWAVYDHMYGETHGVKRLLNVFGMHKVHATFVINGKRVEENPDLAREVQAAGHDMASENYIHEYAVMFPPKEERESLEKTVAAFNTHLGAPPTGYISPGHRPTPNTVPILMDLGYRWDADFQYTDVPIVVTDGDRRMVGMPYAALSDYHTHSTTGRTPRQLLQMMRDELSALRREGQAGHPKMFGYAIHPYICHGFRTEIVHEFLEGVAELDDVWVTTRTEICDWVLENESDYEAVTLDEVVRSFPETP